MGEQMKPVTTMDVSVYNDGPNVTAFAEDGAILVARGHDLKAETPIFARLSRAHNEKLGYECGKTVIGRYEKPTPRYMYELSEVEVWK